ncbi:pLS20_p028 family conjugation system transmembrane protein [Streptococcus uberis]|uniref:pLS20_p028 family conjugation system transmembrane protein n=1 Tax=Streptococcus uberis TaxID=1349 RepID=UPI0037ACDB53
MEFNTYSDVVKSITKEFWDLNGATNGNITGDNGKKLADFYLYWGNYLEPTPAFLAYLMQLVGGIVKALYLICVSLEHVFNNMFKAFGLFGYLGDQTTLFGKLFFGFQVLGTTLFTLILVVSAITGVFSKPVKYKHVITNFLLVTLVTAVLPLALTTISQTVAQDAQSIQTMSTGDSKENYSSLAIQPMKNNVVDVKVLMDNDFNKELFPLDSFGFIKPLKEGSTAVNNITDDTKKRDTTNFATKIDFSAMYGVSNEQLLKDLEKKKEGTKELFLHKLNTNQDGVETINTHRVVGGLNAFEPVYLRYKVNWIGMIAQYLILISLFIVMSIKFVKSVFDIFIESLISPIQGYSSLNSKKYKELLRTIGGGLAGIFFEIVIMRITLEICRDLPTLSVTGISKLSGGFFDGLNMWEQCIAACVVYIALFLSAMQGVTMIERWLGVSTGHNETAQQLIGAMMMGNAFATGAGALGSGALALATGGTSLAAQAPGAIASAGKHVANSFANTAGGLKGISDSIKDQGFGNTVKGGVSNAVDLATLMGNKAGDKVGGAMDSLDQKAQDAHSSTYNALKNNATVPEPGWESENFGLTGGEYTLNPSHNNYGEDFFPSGGVSDPSETTSHSVDTTAPKAPKIEQKQSHQSTSGSEIKRFLQQMNYMQQQSQQAAQRMQQPSSVKGVEIDEEE